MGAYLSNRWSSSKANEKPVDDNRSDDDDDRENDDDDENAGTVNGVNGEHQSNGTHEESEDYPVIESNEKIKECSVYLNKIDNVEQESKNDAIAFIEKPITYDEVVSSYEKAHLTTNDTGIDSTEATLGTLDESEANLTTTTTDNGTDYESNNFEEGIVVSSGVGGGDDIEPMEGELSERIRDQYNRVRDNLKRTKQLTVDEQLPVARKSSPMIIEEISVQSERYNLNDDRYYCTFSGCKKSYKLQKHLQNHFVRIHENNGHTAPKRVRELLDTESTGSHSDSAESKSDISSLSDYQGSPKKARKEKTSRSKKKLAA